MKTTACLAALASFMPASPLLAQSSPVLVSGLENFATQTPGDTSRYYTNAEAIALGYGTNSLGDGYVVSNVYTSFNNSEYYYGDGNGGDFLTFSNLMPGLTYTVSYLVGNYSSAQRSALGLAYDFEIGGGFQGVSLHDLYGPATGAAVVGWSDGAGQAITWNTSSYTFTATDSTLSLWNFWDNVDISATVNLSNSLGLTPEGPDYTSVQVAIAGITVTQVPEPSGLALLGLFGSLALFRRRRGN